MKTDEIPTYSYKTRWTFAGFHILTVAIAITMAFWAEEKWHVIARNEIDLGVWAMPIQYLVEWRYLIIFSALSAGGLMVIFKARPKKNAPLYLSL